MKNASGLSITVISLLFPFYLFSQTSYKYYNTDSLIDQLSQNPFVNQVLKKATTVYETAKIDSAHISLNAFKIALLEKLMLDSNLLVISAKNKKAYKKKNILTIVDFTKTADKRRFLTIDLTNNRVLFDTLVSHGSSRDQNGLKTVPQYFANTNKSNRSSLGLIIAMNGTQPANPGHFCKHSLTLPHDCSMFLSGAEATVNDLIKKRAIVMHTTGSKNFGDSLSQQKLSLLSNVFKIDTTYYFDEKRMVCFSASSRKEGTPAYAAEKYIRKQGNFIGRSLGCLVLPEESHINIIKTIKDGSLIFAYSDIITLGGTNYFEESPLIQQIVAFVNKEKTLIGKTNKP